jgi:hypothetical protein
MKNGIATDLLDTATFWYTPKVKNRKNKKDKSEKEIEFLAEQQ